MIDNNLYQAFISTRALYIIWTRSRIRANTHTARVTNNNNTIHYVSLIIQMQKKNNFL